MKASDLLTLVTERDDDAMGKVSYKNDRTPDNHVKGKKMKEVNPLPDKGEKKDRKPKANVGDVKKKERRSMEGPRTGARKMSEQAPSTAGIEVGQEREASPAQMRAMKFIKMHNPDAGGGMSEVIVVNPRAYGPRKDPQAAPFKYLKASKAEVDRAMMGMQASGNPGDVQASLLSLVNHRDAQDMSAQQLAQRTGQARQPAARPGPNVYKGQVKQPPADWKLESLGEDMEDTDDFFWHNRLKDVSDKELHRMATNPSKDPVQSNLAYWAKKQIKRRADRASRRAPQGHGHKDVYPGQYESADNPGSMNRKQPVKQGGPVSKTATVRSAKQNDEPKPTAKVGKPKKKERRSMDENPAPVKDFKGGDNEHKKMGVHESVKELEKLLNRKIDTTFLK